MHKMSKHVSPEEACGVDSLTKGEQQRVEKLSSILDALRSGKNVQNRQLQRWLADDEYAQLKKEWEEQKEIRKELKEKPQEIKLYEKKLKQAVMLNNRSEAYARKGKKSASYKCRAQSEGLCEEAFEVLQEILAQDPFLRIWFDREVEFEQGSLIDASLANLPRLVTSRSIDKQSGDFRLKKKQEIKLGVVERALYDLRSCINQSDFQGFKESSSCQLATFLKIE